MWEVGFWKGGGYKVVHTNELGGRWDYLCKTQHLGERGDS